MDSVPQNLFQKFEQVYWDERVENVCLHFNTMSVRTKSALRADKSRSSNPPNQISLDDTIDYLDVRGQPSVIQDRKKRKSDENYHY